MILFFLPLLSAARRLWPLILVAIVATAGYLWGYQIGVERGGAEVRAEVCRDPVGHYFNVCEGRAWTRQAP